MFRHILVPLDRSPLAEQAVGTAAAIARASGCDVSLVLAHRLAAYDGFLDSSTWSDARDPEETIYLRAIADEIARGAHVTVNAAVETGRADEVICRRAHEIGADLIVMTSHGRTGLSRAWMGSVADGVVRHASVPVLILRAETAKPRHPHEAQLFHRILVPLDGSTTAAAIIPTAAEMARATNATLILARVVIPVPLFVFDAGLPAYPTSVVDPDATRQVMDGARQDMTALAERVEHEYGLHVETVVEMGDHPATALLDIAKAKAADLVAMTTHGRSASRLVIGSVTDKVLRGGHLPLLLFHPRAAGVEPKPIEAKAGAMPSLAPA
jgi:nucleotide-binding universal stress UspA family protein